MLKRIRLRQLLIISAATLITACGTVTTPQKIDTMNVDIQIKDYHQGTSTISMHFATQNFSTIEFVSGETARCNQQPLKYESNPIQYLLSYGSYIGEVPRQPTGGQYTFTYKPVSGSDVSIPVQVIDAQVTGTQPAQGATVSLPTETPLKLTYTSSHMSNTVMSVVLTDSRGKFAIIGPAAENGTMAVTPDKLAEFQPGPGMIYFVRITTNYPASQFHHLKVEYQNITINQILWQ
jgi:hypothetical protein